MLFWLCCFVILGETDVFDEAMGLLYSGKPTDARSLLEEDLGRTGSEKTLFGLAWLDFSTRDYERAEITLQFLLDRNPRPMLAGACLNTRGLIAARRGNYSIAEEAFFQALRIYKDKGSEENVVRVQINLAELCLRQDKIQEADRYLMASFRLNTDDGKHKLNPGYLYPLVRDDRPPPLSRDAMDRASGLMHG